jgi:hypothetical protein
MTDRDSFPDDVPVADAVEQNRWTVESTDLGNIDPDELLSIDDDVVPLESNESDWQEQHQIVEDPDRDEFD